MNKLGFFCIIAGLLFGISALLQMESVRISMATKYANDNMITESINKEDVVHLVRGYATNLGKFERILFVPFFMVGAGIILLWIDKRKLRTRAWTLRGKSPVD